MGLGKGSRTSGSIASSNKETKRKAEAAESLSSYARGKQLKSLICDHGQLRLDKTIEKRDLATQQRDEARSNIPHITTEVPVPVGCFRKITISLS
jgi:hypothetical protein